MAAVIAVAGSRVISAAGAELVTVTAAKMISSGCSLAVGCCTGVDAAVLSADLSVASVQCSAVFGPDGSGAGPFSNVDGVLSFNRCGGVINWCAGGALSLPLPVRLVARTRSVISSSNQGLIVFFNGQRSRGSLLACRLADSMGLPVWAFPLDFSGRYLPCPGAGHWRHVSGWPGAWRWVSAQQNIFNLKSHY